MDIKKFFGDKAFYKMVLLITIPIIVQNGITSFVSLLDNIMVGKLGTAEMSGVAISNQLMMVFHMTIFGAASGAGIFGAQFFGINNQKGVRNVLRLKIIVGVLIAVLFTTIFALFSEPLLSLYLQGDGKAETAKATLEFGKTYVFAVMFQMIPFALSQMYASSLRECGETVVPMKAGILAVVVNLVGDFVLIFGYCGFPRLGVVGAAVATDLARIVELGFMLAWIYRDKTHAPYAIGVYKNIFGIPRVLVKDVIRKGTPLMFNEYMWGQGQAVIAQCLSLRGITVIAAVNINMTIANLFMVICMSMGSAISIIVGQLLGASKMKEAKDTVRKLIAFAIFLALGVALAMSIAAPFFPEFYDTEPEVKLTATRLIYMTAILMPVWSFCNACYFTIRSGGKTGITLLFDSGAVWFLNIPAAFVLVNFTSIPIVPLYLLVNLTDLIKCLVGYIMVKKGIWMNNIVEDKA